MSRKKTHEEFILELKKINPNIEVLEPYVNNRTKILCKCKICGHEFRPTPNNLLHGSKCPACIDKNIQYTTETFKQKLAEINPNFEVLGEYSNNKTKILVRCKECGETYKTIPSSLLSGKGCKYCYGKMQLDTETFKQKLAEINPNFEVLGEYSNNKTKILVRCKECGHTYKAIPSVLLSGHRCPKCAHSSTSWLQEELFNYFSQKYPSTLYRDKTLIGKELDIVIPELNIAIEPGSWHWHFEKENRLFNDYQKQLLCKEKGYKCITIYDKCTDPEFPWFPCIIYDVNIGEHKELLKDVIENIEDVITEMEV